MHYKSICEEMRLTNGRLTITRDELKPKVYLNSHHTMNCDRFKPKYYGSKLAVCDHFDCSPFILMHWLFVYLFRFFWKKMFTSHNFSPHCKAQQDLGHKCGLSALLSSMIVRQYVLYFFRQKNWFLGFQAILANNKQVRCQIYMYPNFKFKAVTKIFSILLGYRPKIWNLRTSASERNYIRMCFVSGPLYFLSVYIWWIVS